MPQTSRYSVRRLLSGFQTFDGSTAESLIAYREDLSSRWGTGFTERVKIRPGLELILTRYQLRHKLSLHLQVDRPMLSFGCVVTGTMSIDGSSIHSDTVLRDGDGINMWASEGDYSFHADQGNYHSLSLELSQEFLARSIAHAGMGNIRPLEEAISRPSFPPHLSCKPLSSVARSAALGLLTSSREDPLRSLLLESYALTILREQLLYIFPPYRDLSSVPVPNPRRQAERLEEARRLLQASPEKSPRLSELAALVGLNEWSLKRGFRSRFGVTVYDYLRAHRMKIADAMLCSGDYNVSETAFAVGYKNPGRFSIAYRREFGVPPKSRQVLFRNQVP